MGDAALPGFWTVTGLARLTGLHADTVRYHCREGNLVAYATMVSTSYLIPDQAASDFAADVLRRRKAI